MLPMLPKLVTTVLCVSMLYLMIKAAVTASVPRPSGFVRQRRSLTFPYGYDESYLEFIFGVGLPMDLPHPYQVLMSIEIRADYLYPVNASDFTNPTKRREDKEKEKEKKKQAMEMALLGDVTASKLFSAAVLKSSEHKRLEGNKGGSVVIQTTPTVSKNNSDLVTNSSSDVKTNKNITRHSKEESISSQPLEEEEKYLDEITEDVTDVDSTKTTTSIYYDEGTTDSTTENFGDVGDKDNDVEREGRFTRSTDIDRTSTRWKIYHILEMAANNLGMDGRACLLRSICDAAASPLNHHSNGLIGELIHVFLAPSTTEDDEGRYQVSQYYSAERLGGEVGSNCRVLYPECDVSFLDLITRINL